MLSATPADFASSPVSVGGRHTCALPGDGTVLCWGDNTDGQLGNGRVTDPGAPGGDVLVLDTVIANAAAAGAHLPGDCREFTEGAVLVCTTSSPLAGVTAVSAGFTHTCALLVDTTVACWGSNAPIDGGTFSPSLSGGELGDGTLVARPYPAPVIAGPGSPGPLTGVRSLSSASGYTCALMLDTSVRCWGDAPQAHSVAPVSVMGADGQPLTGIADLAAGDRNACALELAGGVVCWGEGSLGSNSPPQGTTFAPERVVTGGGAPLAGVKDLALGHNAFNGPNGFGQGHSCALAAADGGVLCWGTNDVSQLGDGHNQLTDPDPSRDFAAPVITAPGSSANLTGVVGIAAGGYFTCAVLADATVKCWGLGYGGDSFEGAGAPVPLAFDPSLVTAGIAGSAGGGPFAGSAVLAADLPRPIALAAGGDGLCAVNADGSIWCLGFYAAEGMAPVPGVVVTAPAGPTPSSEAPTAAPGPPTPSPAVPTAGPGVPSSVDVDGLTGAWAVTSGPPSTVEITFVEGQYRVTTTVPTGLTGAACSIPPGTVTETFSGSGGRYAGQQAMFNADCTFAFWVSMTASRDSTGAITVLYGGNPGRQVFVRVATGPSVFRNSIPLPWELNLSPAVVVPTVIAGVGLVVLVPFPGSLFNSTLSTNYAEIMRRARRGRRRLRNLVLAPWFALRDRLRLSVGPQPVALGEDAPILAPPPAEELRHDVWWTLPGVAVFIIATALLSGFLDPGFGLNAASAATFVGMLVGLALVLVAFELPSLLLYRRRAIRFWPRALPATIFVSIASVLLSRLTDFRPGYLYGLIITVAVAASLDHKEEGRVLALGTIVTIGLAVLAWLGLGLVAPAAATSSDPLLIGAQTVLSMTVADGVQVAAIGMVPLSVLAGATVRRWNPFVHAALWLFGIFAFGIVILNPQNGYLSDTTRTPLLTIVALLAVFSVGSIWFWNYFRRWHARMAALTTVPAPDDGGP